MSSTDTSPSNNGRVSEAWSRSWTHLSIDRRSLSYCRVTFDHAPINTITAATVTELAELIGLIEQDPDLNVVVFDSVNPDFYLAHYDMEHDPSRTAALPAGPTGMHAWLDLLVRLSRAPVVSIASIRGRARGAGSEFVLACDLRFASRENTLLGQFEVGTSVVAGGGPMARLPRLVGRGRALEILLVADDVDGPRAEQHGYVNRVIADHQLDDEVEAIASRLARFDHDAIARTKSYVDQVTLPADSEFPPTLADLFELFGRPTQQAQSARLEALGFNTDSDLERSLGQRVVESTPDALSSGRDQLGLGARQRAGELPAWMPSLVNTLRRCHSTVRGLRNSRAPISGFDSPSRASRAICRSCAVSSSRLSIVRLRTFSPVARSSVRAS